MAFPPTLFLIGAEKSGTTKLAHLLSQHPDICLATGKEPAYFTHNYDKGLDWYEGLFATPEARYLLDASVGYTQAYLDGSEDELQTPRRIHELSPDAKFLYLLRNPAERLYSAYQHFTRTGREQRSLDELLDDPGDYFFTGDYAGQLACYLKFFDRDAFLLLRNEDLASDPEGMLARICTFLGLEPVELSPELLSARTNAGYALTPAGKLLWKLTGSRDTFNSLVRAVSTVVPDRLRPVLARTIARKPEGVTPEQQRRLDAMFAAPLAQLERLSGLDVSAWRSG